MKHLYALLMFMALALLWVTPVQAQEAVEMPPVLLEQLGLEPGCTVLESTQVWSTETCVLNCGNIHPNPAVNWYKKALVENGFKNATLKWAEGGTRSTADKDGANVVVQGNKLDEYTQVVLTIDNIEALGGTPVDPDAVAEEVQGEGEEAVQETVDGATPPEGGDLDQVLEQAGISPDAKEATGPITEEGTGLSAEIWDIVTMHPGDTIVEEFMTNGNPGVELASSATTEEILGYYSDALTGAGWMQVARHVEEDGGMVTFFKDEDSMTVATNVVASGIEYHLLLGH